MKAVIPAAGLGTRFLPITKAQPKEMLPIADKPAIQYVVEEASYAGIDDILIITGRGKRAIEDHFDKSNELEHLLEGKKELKLLKEIRKISNLAHIHYIRQKVQSGLGDAIFCARRYVGNEPFAVLLGDTITTGENSITNKLINLFKKYKASIIAVEEVLPDKVDRYGIIAGEKIEDNVYKINGMIEKPNKNEAPSNLAIFGRYLLTPAIFDCIEKTKPGRNGEVQLTDAMIRLLDKEPIYAYKVKGNRWDIGSREDWLKANIEISLQDKQIKENLLDWLSKLVKK